MRTFTTQNKLFEYSGFSIQSCAMPENRSSVPINTSHSPVNKWLRIMNVHPAVCLALDLYVIRLH